MSTSYFVSLPFTVLIVEPGKSVPFLSQLVGTQHWGSTLQSKLFQIQQIKFKMFQSKCPTNIQTQLVFKLIKLVVQLVEGELVTSNAHFFPSFS